MAVLSTTFKLVDDMSDKLLNLGTTGQEVEQQLQNIGTAASYLEKVSEGADNATIAFSETSDVIQGYNEWQENSLEILTDYINSVEGAEDELNSYIGTTENSAKATKFFSEELKVTQQEYEKTSDKTEEYGNTNKEVFENLNNLIAAVGIVTFLDKVYDGYAQCIEVAGEYETAIAKTSTIADTSVLSIDEMGSEMLELSEKTGVAVTALSEAEYQALSAGVATDKAAQFVEQANELAVGGFTQTATAVDVLTTALNAYQMDISETSHVSDVLIQTQNLGKTTVDELANSMGRVIPTASAYNVSIEDLASSYATLTANGIATNESTTYINSMLNELADSGSGVSTVLNEQTGKSFSALMAEGNSLGDVIAILGNSVDNDTTAFSNLWSSAEALKSGITLLNTGTDKYNTTLDKMINTTGAASDAYDTMTSASEHTVQAVETAGTNLKIAIGNTMLPATNKFNEAWANTLNGLTAFVEDNPAVVKALTAGTVGIAAATTAVTLYSVKEQIATVATLALKSAQDALSGPVGVVIGLITAGATALAAWAMSADDALENAEQLTVASQEQAEAVEAAKIKYEEAAQELGEDYPITQRYKEELDELTESYEKNKETIGDLVVKNEELAKKHQELISNDETDKINNQASATEALVTRLSELGSQTNRTASEKAEMLTIVEELNEAFPDLSLNYEDVINKTADTKEALLELVDKEYDNQQLENAKQAYIDTKALLEEQQELFEKMNAEMEDPYEKYINSDGNIQAQAEWDAFWNAQETVTNDSGEEIKKTWGEVYEESAERLKELQDKVNSYGDEIAELACITDDGAESTLSASEASIKAAGDIQGQLDNLVIAYDETYQAALSSIQGQYSLWDEVGDVSETSASTLMSNLDTQITYWQNYADNLENLQSRNIEGLNELVASMDDRSEESAAALAGMASASDEELQKIVSKYTDLQGEQDRTASNAAEMQKNFKSELDALSGNMKTAIDDMELSDEASAAAKDTIDSYVAQIRSGISEAGSAAAAVSKAVQDNLGTSLSLLGSKITLPENGYAEGTLNAEPGLALVGEEGPELINFSGGEVVYTAGETNQILNRNYNILDPYRNYNIHNPYENCFSVDSGYIASGKNSSDGVTEKVITLKLEGIGSIQIGASSGVSKEELADFLAENIKPVLISVINDEIYEEGEYSYEY